MICTNVYIELSAHAKQEKDVPFVLKSLLCQAWHNKRDARARAYYIIFQRNIFDGIFAHSLLEHYDPYLHILRSSILNVRWNVPIIILSIAEAMSLRQDVRDIKDGHELIFVNCRIQHHLHNNMKNKSS